MCLEYILCLSKGAEMFFIQSILGKGIQFCCYTICALYDVFVVYVS